MTHSQKRPGDPFTERTPRVVSASKLGRAAARRKQGRFLAEGVNSVEAALNTGAVIEVFHTEHAAQKYPDLVGAATSAGVQVSPITDRAAKSLADTVTSTGLFAVCRRVVRQVEAPDRLVVVGQELGEPGNVGTLIRIADALGADEVWLTAGSADPEGPKAVRASAGSLFHVPVVTGLPVDEVVDRARSLGMTTLAATGDGETDLTRATDLLARPTAWIFGNEAHGVAESVRAAADARVRIPLHGRAESLNITTAAAICLHASATAQHARQ